MDLISFQLCAVQITSLVVERLEGQAVQCWPSL